MNCPLRSEEGADLLLEYSAGKLDESRAAELERHVELCEGCAAFRMEQAAVLEALNAWIPPPVSVGFNRALWRKIDAAAASVAWHERLANALRQGVWKPAVSIAAAFVVIAAGFVFDHQSAKRANSAAVEASATAAVSISEADQVEKALDDVQLLRQFDAASGSGSGASKTM